MIVDDEVVATMVNLSLMERAFLLVDDSPPRIMRSRNRIQSYHSS